MLAKRLKGSKYHIYEVKLDSGQRILWSRIKQRKSTNLHVSGFPSIFCVYILFMYLYIYIVGVVRDKA